jgi:hypothetical protein
MTFIEQACHARATRLWRMRPNLNGWRVRVFVQLLRYCEISAPTASATILLSRHVVAFSAKVLRRNSPAISEWKTALASEPELINRKMFELRDKAEDEIRLHQDIFARLFRWA